MKAVFETILSQQNQGTLFLIPSLKIVPKYLRFLEWFYFIS